MRTNVRITEVVVVVTDAEPGNAHERASSPWSETVAARRKALGLRQEDLADLAGVSHRFVQSVEAGKTSVRLDKLQAVLHALGLRLEAVPVRGDRL